uniref:Roadblock/LC7 domain-containing protein n=1 Tax=Caenorhabditis tropicalis TaxID=1561998 RepID=A0A1I7T779_9PELO
MSEYKKYINRLMKVKPINQVAIIDFSGEVIRKSDISHFEDPEFEVFNLMFNHNTQIKSEYMQLSDITYHTKLTESHFLYGENEEHGMMAVKTEKLYVIVLMKSGKDEFTQARRVMDEVAATLRNLGL